MPAQYIDGFRFLFFATTIFWWLGCAEPTKNDALENSSQQMDAEVASNLDLDPQSIPNVARQSYTRSEHKFRHWGETRPDSNQCWLRRN